MLRGVISPVITVFNDEGRFDFDGNSEVIENLIRNGINGILFLGSIGEFFNLSFSEKKEFISFVIKTVAGRVPVLIGTGGTVVDEVISLTQYAKDEGAYGVVIISPYYFNLDDESLYRYYSEIAKSVDIPIYLYNFPDRTSVNMSPELVLRLAMDFKNIVGIKDTLDSISHTRKLIRTIKSKISGFSIFSGFDEYLVPNLQAGGDGIIGGLTNIAPGLFSELFKAYYEKDFLKISTLQKRVNILMELYDVSKPFVPAIKAAAACSGRKISSFTKKPAGTLDELQLEQIKEILKRAGVI